jgi:hypothetical protein
MTGEAAPAPEASADVTATVPLDDFCRGLSVNDKRVELIAGFHFDEKCAGHLHDVESAYLERYAAFAVRPVK